MRPGVTSLSVASIRRLARAAGMSASSAAMRPNRTATSRRAFSFWLGSTTLPPLITRSNLSSGRRGASAAWTRRTTPAPALAAINLAPFSRNDRRDRERMTPPLVTAPVSHGRLAMRMGEKKPTLYERAQRAEQTGNRDTRELGERFRGHRQHVTAEILALAPGGDQGRGGRLGLLGAGNGNDLDLEALGARFDEVHLVDIDPGALARATGRQSPAAQAKLRSHAPGDLSGLYQQRQRKARPPPADALVAAGPAEVARQLPSELDVVASCCVLSQMAWALEHLAAPDGTANPTREQAL